jgi:hypothetical protein
MQPKNVKIFCQQEQRIIATMPLPPAGRMIDANWVWREYRPAAQDYALPMKRTKDREYLLCPKCYGKTELVSDDVEQVSAEKADKNLPQAPGVSREAVRAKIISDMSGSFHERVDSKSYKPEGRPFVLGAVRVKAQR